MLHFRLLQRVNPVADSRILNFFFFLFYEGVEVMKESMYNLYFLDEKEKKCLIFNTLQRSIIETDYEVYSLLKSRKIEQIDTNIIAMLHSCQMIYDDTFDEHDLLKIMFCREKFKSTTMGITVIPTHLCNLACKYCYQGHGDVLHSTMNKAVIEKTIAFIKNQSRDHTRLGINLYGGEPFLYPDIGFTLLEELHTFAQEKGKKFMVTVTTNGTLITEDIVQKLKSYSHRVQITLCGSKEVHDEIRVDKKGNGTYERIMKVIALLIREDISFHIRIDVDQNSVHSMEPLLQDMKERGFQDIYLGFSPIGEEICYKEMEMETERISPGQLSLLADLAKAYGFRANPIYIQNFIEGCSALSDSYLTVDPKGDVYKCLATPNYEEHKIGTIDEDGNLIHTNYKAYVDWTLRDPLCIPECRDCIFSPLCAGGCALAAYRMHGSLNTPGCKDKNLGGVIRSYLMVNYPELFKESSYETIVL